MQDFEKGASVRAARTGGGGQGGVCPLKIHPCVARVLSKNYYMASIIMINI